MSTKKTKFKRTTNFEHCAREVAANNEDIAVVRELISNGYDALSPEIIFGPLPDNEQKGLFCCDFGTGMPLWTSAEEYIDSKKSKAGASSSAGPRDIKKPMDTQASEFILQIWLHPECGMRKRTRIFNHNVGCAGKTVWFVAFLLWYWS